MRGRSIAVVVAALVVVAVAGIALVYSGVLSGGDDDRQAPAAEAPGESAPRPSGAVATPPPSGPCDGDAVDDVATAEQLEAALERVSPGAVVRLADGIYEGEFTADTPGTAEEPIVLCGGRGAVLDGGPVDGGYTLHLDGADYWRVSGFTVRGGQKGVMVDSSSAVRIEDLLIEDVGDEALHLRAGSSDNLVTGTTISGAGLRREKFGEGIYVGSAESNWCDLTDCEPDRSDRNVIEANEISGTTAEAVDIKEGTTGGILRGNTFDGSAATEADSWVDVKGNDWLIVDNVGVDAPEDGFQAHEILPGWGVGNVFAGNRADVDGPGIAINMEGGRELREGNEVRCDNEAVAAGGGLSNVDCVEGTRSEGTRP